MKTVSSRAVRYTALNGWTNTVLRIDLSSMRVWTQETARYVPNYMGARGIAARIAWDEYPEPVDPFAPENPLMIFPGALAGTRAPYSGRMSICTFSPQTWPYHWFTRSNVGGSFGPELKRAGYDGLIVTGASEEPVRIVIRDDDVRIEPADDFWGLDTQETLDAMERLEGRKARSLVIGPAGERLSRISTIHTASSSACGHGGFGAVMGAKKLKAITVVGTGQVAVADPERMRHLTRALATELRTIQGPGPNVAGINEGLAAAGGGTARPYACTEGCLTPCGVYYRDVPGCAHAQNWDGHWFCVSPIMSGIGEDGPISRQGVFDWRLGLRGGFEMNVLSNRYGLNQWELVISMVPWLAACQRAGLISEFNGMPMDWRSPQFWDKFLHDLTYREGMGDVLAEGGWQAAYTLDLGRDLMHRFYTGWGIGGHWDGHADFANYIVFPYWLVSALQWATDTRDPIPSGHGYVSRVMRTSPLGRTLNPDRKVIPWDELRQVSQRIYGDPEALDASSEYRAKAMPAYYHTRRSVIKDCVPVDDVVFPLLYSENTPDRIPRILDVEGPSVEYELFRAGTGVTWSEDEFNLAAERVYTMERALQVRHWGRTRALDESVLPAFEYPENWTSPLQQERRVLDREAFGPVMDDYYRLQGWDTERGWPTPERLEQLGLADVHGPMVEGAARASAALPIPPSVGPVPVVFEDQAKR